jgi:hypothetical protein
MSKLSKKFAGNNVRKIIIYVDFERRSQNTGLKFKIWLCQRDEK